MEVVIHKDCQREIHPQCENFGGMGTRYWCDHCKLFIPISDIEKPPMSLRNLPQKPEYSFCESAWASGASPWHIRKLTDKGRKLGGGADTRALCGREVAWDLQVELTEHHLGHSCQACVSAYRNREDKNADPQGSRRETD